jgi:hypothetical protein
VGVALHLPGLQMYFGPIVELFRNMLFAASSTVSGIGTSSVVNGFGISMSVDSRYVIYNAVLLAGQLGITIAAVLLALKHTVFNVLLSRKASKEDKREGLIFLTVFSTAVFVLGAAIAELNRREIATDSSAQVSTEIIDKIKTTESKVAAPISWDWVQLGKSSLSPEMETKRLAYIAGMTDYLQPGKGLKEIKYMDSDDDEKTVFVVLDRLSDDLRPLSPMQTQPLTDGIYANLLTRHRDLSILENYLAYLEHQQNVYGVPTWMDVVGNKVQPSTRVTVGIEDLTGYVAQLWLAKLNLEVRLSQTTDVASNNQITRSIGRLEKLIESNQSTFQALVDPEKGLLYRELVVRTGKPDPTKGHKDRMAVEDLYAIMILSAVYDLPDTVWKNAPLEVQNYTDSNGKTYPVLAPYNGEAFIGGMNATFWPSDQLKSLFANTGLYFLDQAKQGKSAFPSPAYVGRDYMNAGGTIAEVPSSRNDLNVPNAQAMYSGVPTVFEEFTQKHPTPRVFLDTNDQSGASATLVLPAAAALLNIEKPDYSGVSPETAEVLKGANDQYDVLEAEAIKKSAEPKETAPKKEASAPKAPRSELRESLTDVDALSAALETKTEFTFDQTRQSVLASQQEFKKLEVTLEDALRDHRTAMIRALGLNSAIVSGRGETLIRYREGVDSDAYLANMIQLLALRNVKVVIFTDDDDQAERLRIALSKLKAPNLSIKLLTELADYLDKKREEYNLDQALQIVTDARLYKDQRELIETVLTTTAVELSQNNLILLGWDEQVQGIRPFTPFNKFLDKIVQTLKAEMKISQSA